MHDEKVYLTRDEGSDNIFVWHRPSKGNWSPNKMKDCDMVNWQREDINNVDHYHKDDFKKKFGFIIPQKKRQCVRLSKKLLDCEDYKLISNDPDRKR